ncbi:GNAT family N-acetyltransferase [Microbacterium aurugineum]|uniref:GNAT family N-acetyltransferase n=1 Tax=Microbacterium aurugineum TaxID=2851642 RepID=UPI0020BDF105|nr:GNAT family N-acetyltransferase [Microbacterium aurugineum]MCK8478288.1 GNAT family N-acetyltransferase [Microbacterium aurugineum]
MGVPPVRRATTADLGAAADTLAEAFEGYPWTRHVLPEDDYEERLRALQLLYLRYAQAHGIVAVTDACDGVIALLPPDAPEPDDDMVEQIVALHGDRLDRLAQPPAPSDAWKLETLGVRPASQGRGIAAALLEFALAVIAERGAREVCLETSDPRNVRLYARHGFRVVSHSESAEDPPIWHMSAALDRRREDRGEPLP